MENNLLEIKEFIKQWKVRAYEYYRNAIVDCKKEIIKIYDIDDSWDRRSAFIELRNKYNALIVELSRPGYYSPEARAEKITKFIEKEAIMKEQILIARVNKAVGKIVKAINLEVGVNGELNGIIQGENGTIKIETIYAGGYNIQCLHYRVLIHKVSA